MSNPQHEQASRRDNIDALNARLAEFARARDWEQFHTPKNLSMALIGEAAELVEHFQWLTPEQSANLPADKLDQVALFIYTIRAAKRLGVDLIDAAWRKIDINEARYPADQVRGDPRRVDEYESSDHG